MTDDKIEEIYEKYEVLPNIKRHMRAVANFAGTLCDKLLANGVEVAKEKVVHAALLHDICRLKPDHGEAAAGVLRELGEPELADMVLKHEPHEVFNIKTIEEEIVHYADKRVLEDKIVSTEERFAGRGWTPDNKYMKKLKEIEKELLLLAKIAQ